MQTQLVPDGLAIDPLQATAKTIRQFGDAAMKIYVRKGQRCWKERGGNKKRKSRGNTTLKEGTGAPLRSKHSPKGTAAHGGTHAGA